MWDVENQITSHRQLSKTVCHIMLTSDQMWSPEIDIRTQPWLFGFNYATSGLER